jgi:hypothetical protein
MRVYKTFDRAFYRLCLYSVAHDTGFFPWKRALEYWQFCKKHNL